MEHKQLLLITNNENFTAQIKSALDFSLRLTSVKSVHAGYTLALSHLPDVILIDFSAIGRESMKNIQSFKATHFLAKSSLFLYGSHKRQTELETKYKDYVDGIFYDSSSITCLVEKLAAAACKKRVSDYWKASFMGLFNLLEHPVVLLQHDSVIAMNDSFKNHFYITNPETVKLTDFVDCGNKYKSLEILRNFVRGKHMKASSKAKLFLKDHKSREAQITLSKLDKDVNGQVLLLINFAEQVNMLNEQIGTSSRETEAFFEENNSMETFNFTKREKEIIGLLCKGYKTKEISENLCISPKTIEKHRSNIIKRTNSDTILESIIYALNHKLVQI